ncbi:MAG: sugar phosphate isomerase/epimerase, partial [Pseudomonadota bacterium]
MYTLREFTKTPAEIAVTLKKVSEIGYQAVQASGMGPIEPGELRRIADGEGLTICATHVDFERFRDETDAVIEEHRVLGCEHPAVGSMPVEYRQSAEEYRRFAREAEEIGRKLAEAGMT